MKTQKLFLSLAVVLSFLTVSATNPHNASTTKVEEECLQCGVTNAQITEYLVSKGHTVYSVWDIPGTCNSGANIENCMTATVYVSGGRIIGYSTSSGFCQ